MDDYLLSARTTSHKEFMRAPDQRNALVISPNFRIDVVGNLLSWYCGRCNRSTACNAASAAGRGVSRAADATTGAAASAGRSVASAAGN